MKRIFFCVNYPKNNPAIGISKKILMQMEAFKKLGYEVTYSAYTDNGVAIFHDDSVIVEDTFSQNKINLLFKRFKLLKLCKSYLNSHKFEIGFIRWNAVDRLFLDTLSCLDESCKKVIMDFHGYFPAYNVPSLKGRYTSFMTKINGDKMSEFVDIGLTETKNQSLFGIPTIPIDTGIDVDKYQIHNYKGKVNTLNMISVANELSYHGYDRIINGLSAYLKSSSRSMDVHLHLIGKMSKKTQKSIIKLNLEKNVTLHGYLSGDKLIDIYNQSNIGIGPLAPHRSGGKEGTGIKTKEYFAIGLPYFYAGNELLIPCDYPFIHKVEDDDSPIDIHDIIEFYNRIQSCSNVQDEMRQFAREVFSWNVIFSNTLNKLYGEYVK